MDNRSFESAASATPPSAPASPSSGYPTNGNPSLAIPATIPGDYWFYQLGEELRAAIVAGGLTPAAGTLNQLASAIFKAKSLAANGYQTLPSGLIIQWGKVSVTGTQSFSFPLAFPTAAWSITLGDYGVGTNQFGVTIDSLTQFTVINQTGVSDCYWMAIGN